ncbi:PhoU family transcriptional regulator [Leptospira sp. 2 VSF19]|uniref:PhoU family transcriptional regulator n=1 Tax=Leptospira soteropolitanensis TaxID=2950025 RepID=A0AAW5VSG3_9LEPT|nr:PhoU domain-containing protein [Leptospira soteropolitanensis]MCW7494115.1 PhoU family transcriptional regulator [Leptospira soteropolitanensis]MCW7501619.1 PhoU family transcriptional regulator [Leptospira soteropolitanensis]MCW7523961.1 PhoU family transcriptional regulator [Leptospira soteropolitanensis]MCW7527826.1 PhoU family transcriptional regulator [Leptospira soteropolitanensis]MCW7531589.1 PhoU family transcriptional regulator [Leptospira soteropolitanensis]
MIISKFYYLRKNLYSMAELVLEQVILLSEALEADDYEQAERIVERDDLIDDLEKENDNLSQNAILEAVSNRNILGMGDVDNDIVLKKDPLRFALSAIRITRNMERMGDQVVNCADVFRHKTIRKGLFKNEEPMTLILSRVTTLAGMAIESLVEEKERFMGSVNTLEDELNALCDQAFHKYRCIPDMEKQEFADVYRIILALERLGDYAVNVAEELVRLNTGKDIRHLENVKTKASHFP